MESQRKVVGRKGWNHRGRCGTGRGRMTEAGGEEGMESEDWLGGRDGITGWCLGGRGGITEAGVEEIGSQRQEWKR